MLTDHCIGHECNRQVSKQAKESLVVHAQQSYKIQLFTQGIVLSFFLKGFHSPCPHPLHSNAIFVPWRCGDERMMDGWMLLVWVFHHHFPWGTLSAGREHHPKRWYLLQTRQLTDSFSLCIFPQRRAGLIWFLYGIFHHDLFDFPCSQYTIINKTLGVGTAEMLRLHTLVTLIDSHFKLSWDLIAC